MLLLLFAAFSANVAPDFTGFFAVECNKYLYSTAFNPAKSSVDGIDIN